jgi:hypothetical protein
MVGVSLNSRGFTMRLFAAAVIAVFCLVGSMKAGEKAEGEQFSAEYRNVKVSATVPKGWSRDTSEDAAPGTTLLGAWTGEFGGLPASLIIQSVPEIPYYVEDYANQCPYHTGLSRSAKIDRPWALSEGRNLHNQLVVALNDKDKPYAYFWRCVKVERVGRDCVAMILIVRLGENPGTYVEYKNSAQVKPHLVIPDTFKVEKK